jgi:hypothetical protein
LWPSKHQGCIAMLTIASIWARGMYVFDGSPGWWATLLCLHCWSF